MHKREVFLAFWASHRALKPHFLFEVGVGDRMMALTPVLMRSQARQDGFTMGAVVDVKTEILV